MYPVMRRNSRQSWKLVLIPIALLILGYLLRARAEADQYVLWVLGVYVATIIFSWVEVGCQTGENNEEANTFEEHNFRN